MTRLSIILDVATGYEGDRPAVQVTFDPKALR
jgi:hypothetical protein